MTIPPKLIESYGERSVGMSLADYARDRLIDLIVSLEFAPGTAIVEKELLETLELGRTPVREALQQIAGMGLVCRLPHVGMYVCEVTHQSLRDIYELRSCMDGTLAERAAARATPTQVEAIVAAAKAIESAYDARDLSELTSAGRKFAARLAEATGNLHCIELTPRLFNLDARLTWIANQEMGDWDILGCGIAESALSIAGVIVRRLPSEARLLAELHVERRYSFLTTNLDLSSTKAQYSIRA